MNGVFGSSLEIFKEMLFETGCEQETTSRHSSESVWTLPKIGSLWHHVLAGRLLMAVLRWPWVGPTTRRWFRVLSVLRICMSCPPRRPQWITWAKWGPEIFPAPSSTPKCPAFGEAKHDASADRLIWSDGEVWAAELHSLSRMGWGARLFKGAGGAGSWNLELHKTSKHHQDIQSLSGQSSEASVTHPTAWIPVRRYVMCRDGHGTYWPWNFTQILLGSNK